MVIFKNCLISTGFQNETHLVDILVNQGKIVSIESKINLKEPVVDIDGKLLVPGAIDPHVHFNEPGFTHHEDFYHGTASAAKGGVTTIIDMPCTSLPPVTNLSNLYTKLDAIKDKAIVDFAFWGGVSGKSFSQDCWEKAMEQLTAVGVVGFKTYALSGMETFTAVTPDQLHLVLQKAKQLDVVVGHHAEDPEIVTTLTEKYQRQGRTDAEAYWLSRPAEAEIKACARAIFFAQQTGAALHIVHVSSAEAVKEGRGVNVTFETCPHFLTFTKEDLLEKKGFLKTAPVVKTKEDVLQLWDFLASGKVQFLATDHAPCTKAEKQTGSIWTDYGGVPGTELMLNFAYSEGVRKDRITLARMIEITSTNAAMRFGLYPTKGALVPGADADFAVIDTQKKWIVSSELQSKGKFTPFEGFTFSGQIIKTYLRGEKIFDLETGVNYKPGGQWIQRKRKAPILY